LDNLTLVIVAVSLAMDALAVAVAIGLCTKERAVRAAARVGLSFGFFQAGMTVLGWLVGSGVAGWVNDASQWVAAALLWLVGGHMLVEAMFRKRAAERGPSDRGAARAGDVETASPECPSRDVSRGWALIGLSVATSIDAFGVGMGLAFVGTARLWLAALVIGVVAAVLPGAGLIVARHLAARTGGRLAKGAEIAGAVVLIGIGVRIAFFSG